MDARDLRQIIAIRRWGSIAQAAEALGITQPTLSKSIHRLEEELNITIFERTSKGSEITPVGELMAVRAERIMQELSILSRDTALIAGGETGEIRIGVGSAIRDSILARTLPMICARYPKLGLQLEVGEGDQLLRRLEARELDLVMCAARPEANKPSLAVTDLLTAPAIIVASPDHPLARERNITVARLAQFRCAGPTAVDFEIGKLLGMPDEENFTSMRSNDYSALFPLLWSGNIVIVAHRLGLQPEIDAGRAVVLDVDWSLDIPFVAVTTRAASSAPILRQIVSFAQEAGRRIAAGGPASGPPSL